MSTTDAESDQLAKWLTLGESCSTFKDTCLATATAEDLNELPIKYEFGVVGTNSANKITKPATEAEQAAILKRLNWSQTMSQLQLPQSSL